VTPELMIAVGGAELLELDPVGIAAGISAAFAAVLVWWRSRNRPALPDFEDDAQPDAPGAPEAPPAPVGLAGRLRERMQATRNALAGRFDGIFGGEKVDAAALEELEEALLIADVGVPTAEKLVGQVRAAAEKGASPAELRQGLVDQMQGLLHKVDTPLTDGPDDGPLIILVVGVNGSGKTTTIGKLAARFAGEGKKVLLAAGDTYRAAAAEQLGVWAERTGAEFVRQKEGADPGAVTYAALDAAAARGVDVVIVDTAGRLQSHRPLMEQLTKVLRVIEKKVPGAPHETLLVVDGTMGQNAMSQARSFHQACPLSGVVVTKLDGTAKGGMVLAIASEMELPVKFIGIGEGIDDLRPFDADAFIDALM